MFNLLKKYPELLDLAHYPNETQRNEVLKAIYERDIEDNPSFKFREKRIYPIKDDGSVEMARELMHLTCKEVEEDGVKHRVFDIHRSRRLHWIKPHMEETTGEADIEVFSIVERDQKNRKDIKRTYRKSYKSARLRSASWRTEPRNSFCFQMSVQKYT